MHEIIDVPASIAPFAERLFDAGVRIAIRYYNHRNSTTLPSKRLTLQEVGALQAAGIDLATVFEQRAGAGGNIGDLGAAEGARDAAQALQLAAGIGQPAGSAIYFAVDWDFTHPSDLAEIRKYFGKVQTALTGQYKVGVYGSGTVGTSLKAAGLVDHIWLSGSTGWSGTRDALRAGNWSIFQKYMARRSDIGGFGYDGNIVNPANGNFGQFGQGGVVDTRRGVGHAALYKVKAHSGLNLRSGPGETFRVQESLPFGTIVTGTARAGDWLQVDTGGDGQSDGYLFAGFLEPVSGGLPLQLGPAPTALEVARAELSLDVREIPGNRNNPRIVMYHATTSGGSASDETAWCSSFANYCVEQAGFTGTDSKWARSWHDDPWGQDVTANPQAGDIVVFSRQSATENGGHVGFYLSEDNSTVQVLGGNQGDRISISRYPKNGVLGGYTYRLLSIRRA